MYEGEGNKTAAPSGGCRLFDLELAAHLEGEERPGLLAHVGECPFCRSMLADLEGIRLASSELATDEPPPRLWANIRAALVAEGIIRQPQAFWQRWLGGWQWLHNPVTVAALGCLMVLGIGLLKAPRLPRSRKAQSIDLSDVTRATVALGSMETSYQVQALSFEPSMKKTYQKSLDSLDGEIRECLNSVKQEPDNSLAREYLLAAYEQKAYVLESALAMDNR
jgi:hypothetical protein